MTARTRPLLACCRLRQAFQLIIAGDRFEDVETDLGRAITIMVAASKVCVYAEIVGLHERQGDRARAQAICRLGDKGRP